MFCHLAVLILPLWIGKGYSPENPFHRITSSYSILMNLNFCANSARSKTRAKKNQLNRNEKFVDKAQQCFAFLHIKPKFKFAVH